MEKAKIIDSLRLYFKNESTDYAVMINGEWGVGKTYFLKKDVFKLMKELKLRPIYISLIGLNNDVHLERLIFQKINPFYNSNNQSSIAREADYIEAIIKGEEKPDTTIPKNIVLCFDDLERIKPEFFETAMGFINVFIEHYKTKCIFLCNEPILEKVENINYQTVKEKYIRFCYAFSPILGTVIKEKISSLKFEHKSLYDIPLIVSVFNKGETNNLRTLFFVLSIFEQVLNEIDTFQDKPQNLDQIINLILSYCCFYTIESKKGTPYSLLDKITINNLAFDKILLPIGISDQIKDEPLDDNSSDLKLIQNRYFSDQSFQFESFASVAGLIKNGYLDTVILKKEILALDVKFLKDQKRDYESNLVNKLSNVFELSDEELIQTINLIFDEVEKGTFNLPTYLRLYMNLVWLESNKIKGIKIDEEITNKFKKGVEIASKSGDLIYIKNLLFQSQWSEDDKSEYAKKYNQFASYVDSKNDTLLNENHVEGFKDILSAIKENRHDELYRLLGKEDTIIFTNENSKDFYDLLIKANARINNNFLNGLHLRYANSGSFISQMPRLEKGFIEDLFALLNNDEKLNPDVEKPLSLIPLMFLKDYLKGLIERYHS